MVASSRSEKSRCAAAGRAVDTDTLTDRFPPVPRCVDEPSHTGGTAGGVPGDCTVPGRGTPDTAGLRAPAAGRPRWTTSTTSCRDCFRHQTRPEDPRWRRARADRAVERVQSADRKWTQQTASSPAALAAPRRRGWTTDQRGRPSPCTDRRPVESSHTVTAVSIRK